MFEKKFGVQMHSNSYVRLFLTELKTPCLRNASWPWSRLRENCEHPNSPAKVQARSPQYCDDIVGCRLKEVGLLASIVKPHSL